MNILNTYFSSSDESDTEIRELFDVALLPGINFRTICPKIVTKERQQIIKSNFWTHSYLLLPPRAYKKIYRME